MSFLPLVLYPLALAVMSAPLIVGLPMLRRRRLVKKWHFMCIGAAIFGSAHQLYAAYFFRMGGTMIPAAIGASLGLLCGLLWWCVLVKNPGAAPNLLKW